MSNSNTPYDDAFRTLLTDCSRLIIPVVNVLFDGNYGLDDEVNLFQNESFITAGNDEKRITDSNFSVGSNIHQRYHIECQCRPDGSVIVRVFEYATQIAISTAESDTDNTSFNLPKSGILYLHSTKNTKEHTITVVAPNGKKLSYAVPVIRMYDYSLEKLIDKRLWFLIPFYFFNFNLEEMDSSEEMIQEMQKTYRDLWDKMDGFVDNGLITEFEKAAIKAMCDKVAEALSHKYRNVQKGVETVMGGQVLDYEAKRIAREAAEKAAKEAAIKAEKATKEAVEDNTHRRDLEAVKNMILFGVPEEKILSKYPKSVYEEAIKILEQENSEPKEM